MDDYNSLCFYQKFIPKYRYSFFSKLSNTLSKNKNTKLYILIDYPNKNQYIPSNYKFEVVKALSLKSFKLIKKSEYIILEGSHRNLISYLLIFYSFFVKTKTIAYCHFIGSTKKELVKLKCLFRKLYLNLYMKIIFYYKDELLLYKNSRPLYFSNQKSYFANNSIDTKLIYSFKRDYNYKNREIDFISIGRITNKFNLNLLISALEVSSNSSGINIVLIGSEKNETLFVKTKYCVHKIRFIENIWDEKTIAHYTNNAKIFIYPGNIGLSIVHAMAYGLPILIHSEKYSHCPEGSLFKKNKSGITFKKNCINDLSSKITKILNEKEKLISYSNENINIIKKRLSTKIMTNKFYKAIYS